MNASETIQAAIDKLEGLRDDSSAWDWRRRQMTGEFGQTIGSWEDLHAYYGITTHEPVETKLVAQNMLSEDAELIVTLHRTINAQLRSMKDFLLDRLGHARWPGPGHCRGTYRPHSCR